MGGDLPRERGLAVGGRQASNSVLRAADSAKRRCRDEAGRCWARPEGKRRRAAGDDNNNARRFRRGSARGEGRGGSSNVWYATCGQQGKAGLGSVRWRCLLLLLLRWLTQSSSRAGEWSLVVKCAAMRCDAIASHARSWATIIVTYMLRHLRSKPARYPAQASAEHGVHRHPASPSAIRELLP